MEKTTTKKNKVVIVRTSDSGPRNAEVIPIELRIEITPEKELGPITAQDPEGNQYIVSIGLLSKKRAICCCKNKKGKRICWVLKPGEKCECRK